MFSTRSLSARRWRISKNPTMSAATISHPSDPKGKIVGDLGLTTHWRFAKLRHMAHGRTLLREWFKRSNLNQKELAAQIGITDAFLSQLLSGKRRAKLEILIQIEEATGVPVVSWADTTVGRLAKARKPTPNEPNKPDVKHECSNLT
jgi:DNA-binding XRE family transcriptional regulator